MTAELISSAFSQYNAGNHEGAESLCRSVLENPDGSHHVFAVYLIGVIALEKGDLETAVSNLGRAAASSPLVSAFFHNYGVALMRAGDTEKAFACFHQAVALEPASPARAHAPTWRNLGNGALLFEPGFVIDRAYAESAGIVPLHLA